MFLFTALRSAMLCSAKLLLYYRIDKDTLTNQGGFQDKYVIMLTFAGMDMSQLICGGCRTLLMYTRGAASVRCSCCHTVNLAPGTNC